MLALVHCEWVSTGTPAVARLGSELTCGVPMNGLHRNRDLHAPPPSPSPLFRAAAWVACAGLVAAWYALDYAEERKRQADAMKPSSSPRGVKDNTPWR